MSPMSRSRVIACFLTAVLIAILLDWSGLLIGDARGAPAEPLAPRTTSSQTAMRCDPDPTAPCTNTWPRGYESLRAAYNAGKLGPKKVRVPEWYEQSVRRAVKAKGPAFEKQVKQNVPWFTRAVWTSSCMVTIGSEVIQGDLYPRCTSISQINERLGAVKKVTLKCGQTTLVTGMVGRAFGKKGVLIGAVGGGLTCGVDEGLNLYRKWYDLGDFVPGLRSAVPGSNNPFW